MTFNELCIGVIILVFAMWIGVLLICSLFAVAPAEIPL
jgi:hypothetical protein